MDETRGEEEEEDVKSRERRGGDVDVDGEPRAWRGLEELARGEGRRAIANAAVTTATARAAAWTRSLRILPTCSGKR
jgi:hypothetical protein